MSRTARIKPETRKTRYTPWLHLEYEAWESDGKTEYVCEHNLYQYFNLRRITRNTRIRFRISQESQGNDYEVIGGLLPSYVTLTTSKGNEYQMIYVVLGRYLYSGCWIGLERMN